MSERDRILRLNELARAQRIETRHAPFGEHTLRIPWRDWRALQLVFPGLASSKQSDFEQAMRELHESPLADPYRVRPRRAQLGHL